MSKRVPISRGTVPIGGMCRYKDPDAGFEVAHPYYEWCKAWAHDGRVKRGLPIPYNWDEFFDDQLCKAVPQACYDVPEVGPQPPRWSQMATNFLNSALTWMKSGFKVVDFETLKFRVTQCAGDAGDPAAGIPSTPRCKYFTTFNGTTLTRCAKCGCGGLKLHMATEQCPDNPPRWHKTV